MEKAVFHEGAEEPDIDRFMQMGQDMVRDILAKYPHVLLMQVILKYVKTHYLYRNTNGSEDEKFSGKYEIVLEFAGNDGTNTTGISGTVVVTDKLDTPFLQLGSIEKDLESAEKSLILAEVSGKFEGDIIFTPACTQEILSYAISNFASDSVILDGIGLWLNKLGQKVASDKLSVAFKPWDERIVSTSVRTPDGFRTKDMDVINNGILENYVTSLYVSGKCGVKRADTTDYDYVVAAGDTSYEDMIKNVKKGLLVGAISCGIPSANGELSGVAKNSFYIEDGQIKGAATETMISGNLAEMLQNVTAVSRELVSDGTSVVPYIQVSGVTISGKDKE
jgi:PmbA protein